MLSQRVQHENQEEEEEKVRRRKKMPPKSHRGPQMKKLASNTNEKATHAARV